MSNYAEITVADNGIGFDKAYAEQIFVIFKRLYNRDTYEGSGIGPALCKKIVFNHHGEIYADATEKVGTTFFVILPYTQPR
ncbi:MAG: hypothetical protein NVS3B15_09590 [Sediminibacterium sp.]